MPTETSRKALQFGLFPQMMLRSVLELGRNDENMAVGL